MSKKTTLTIEEFRKLSRSAQNTRECDLSDHDRLLARVEDWESSAEVPIKEPELTPELIQQRAEFDKLIEIFIRENYLSTDSDKTNKND
ncbi:MAG: hypothetical protein RSA45_05425 [Hydrogenoanaerobacterium sp.]